jgi:hypothetical protein
MDVVDVKIEVFQHEIVQLKAYMTREIIERGV